MRAQGLGLGILVQTLRPVLERGGLGRQTHGLTLAQLLVGGLQIVEQDRPGDDINGEMMDDQQQACRLLGSQMEEGGAQQWASARSRLACSSAVTSCKRRFALSVRRALRSYG